MTTAATAAATTLQPYTGTGFSLGRVLAAYTIIYDGLKKAFNGHSPLFETALQTLQATTTRWTSITNTYYQTGKAPEGCDLDATSREAETDLKRFKATHLEMLRLHTDLTRGHAFLKGESVPDFKGILVRDAHTTKTTELGEMASKVKALADQMLDLIPLAETQVKWLVHYALGGSPRALLGFKTRPAEAVAAPSSAAATAAAAAASAPAAVSAGGPQQSYAAAAAGVKEA